MLQKRNPVVLTALALAFVMAFSSLALAAVPGDFRDLVKAASPAVVNISTERTEKVSPFPRGFEIFRGQPDLDRFFDQFENFHSRTRKSSSLGSGFIISPDGYIVTNNHVIEGADVIRVNLSGMSKDKNDSYKAEVVGADPDTDLALLKIKASNLPTLSFGDSDALEVGEWVVAIGSPLGLDHTVTAGIVSAKGRNIQSGSYDDFLQTDASINRGNSGGPLLNMDGKVIGINTAIAQRAQGIGFAIPSSIAQRIINDLKVHKKVSRGWLGVTIQNVDSAAAKALGMKESRGALVNSVLEGEPADKAGIKSGDVITAVNGTRIEDTEQLLREVAMLTPGSKADVTVWRDGKEENLSLTVAERGGKSLSEDGGKSEKGSASARLGIKVRPISSDDVRRYGLPGPSGLLVTGVEEGGLADDSGLQPGDVIVAVNKKPVNSPDELMKRVNEAAKQRGALLLQVVRKGQMFYSAIEISDAK